ncbi:MAG: hypothetical protein A7315_04755 [Candidatus Altiarchaeales archaeon WOR_SM1_79]|nr:MAG: hypothetical protein A7315_04755 [Candidatus Altiarchaeales archaeon WOR_SM1_79]
MDLGGISKKDAKGRDNKIPIIGAVIVLVLVIIIIISIVLLLKPPASEQAGNISAVDLDGDGYKNDTDCNDNNPGINPGASINEIYEDGIDTDCDGSDLDGLKRECSTPCGKGFDYRSTEDSDKWGACDAPQPASEKCDGIDNDCDGDTDEDLQQEFGSDIGECEYGTKECRDGSWIIIENATLPVDEIFDLKDNDCDNKVDDGISYGDVCNDLYGLQRLFSWDDILENDSSTLLRFLEDYVGLSHTQT